MKKNLFEYSSYKKYLCDYIELTPELKRGGRIRLSEHLGCRPAFISQVLSGNLDFSLEQIEIVSRFLGLSKIEKKYFLTLLQYERAGTNELRDYLKNELEQLKQDSLVLAKRLPDSEVISEKEQMRYYSHWYYAAIHVLITIPEWSTSETKIAERLSLSLKTVRKSISFLKSTGLVAENKGVFTAGKKSLHLSSDSPLINQHHINWRLYGVKALSHDDLNNLHYSSVISISKEDSFKIKQELIEKISNLKKKIKDSKEEELYSLCLDFFRV